MACPHVSGVVALGLSYAAQLRRHVKAEEVKELLYSTARPIEPFWNTETPKQFYKFVADLSQVHLSSMNLNNYKGKMGHGQVDAYAFLQAIAGAGSDMTFPNVYVAVGGTSTLVPSMYFKNGDALTYTVTIENGSIASCESVNGKLVFKGLANGQTAASVKASNGETASFVITVRNSAAGNGWL
jgi:hypothetical protein